MQRCLVCSLPFLQVGSEKVWPAACLSLFAPTKELVAETDEFASAKARPKVLPKVTSGALVRAFAGVSGRTRSGQQPLQSGA